jgi:hypothetical protein
VVPDVEERTAVSPEVVPPRWHTLLFNPDLARLNWGMFVLHAVLMALFVVIPFSLRDAGLPADRHWQIYLPVMLASIVLMLPPLLAAERKGKQRLTFLASVAVLLGAQAVLTAAGSLLALVLGLVAFFAAFNLLEANLPSLMSRLAPAAQKGAAAGIFATLQFLGAFAGATAGGVLSQHVGTPGVFALCGLLTLSWLLVAWPMSAPATVRVRT